MSNGKCQDCLLTFKNQILKNCSTCAAKRVDKKDPILVYEIDGYRQCRKCQSILASRGQPSNIYIHNRSGCLMDHKCVE